MCAALPAVLNCCVLCPMMLGVVGGVSPVICRSIAECFVQAWDVRNSCEHSGAVLPVVAAPEGQRGDGVDAMA
jgi:hypothetical protein